MKKKEEFTIQEMVYSFPTKNEEGFVSSEIKEILNEYPNIDIEKFNDALVGITCSMKGGEFVFFHCDIEKALQCGLEKRELKSWELD